MTTTAIDPPAGIRSRFVENGNGLRMHVLEAGAADGTRPCILLLHGFPELAYSWRKIMPMLAEAGYHVVAPDQRGYGRTTGWDAAYDGEWRACRFLNLAKDALGLVLALGHRSVAAVFGHDFGSLVAGTCALVRPDVFHAVALMSAPFTGAPSLPFATADKPAEFRPDPIHDDLAALHPPRKHYQWYYSGRPADTEMRDCPQGIHAFLRAYFHFKSADWAGNKPYPLTAWMADELAKLPTYYIMERDRTMAETVIPAMPSDAEIASNSWLPEAEMALYAAEFARTGFQGGLNWYRCQTGGANAADLGFFSGRSIDIPACYISGAADWGMHQSPGALKRMRDETCSRFLGTHVVPDAGHWVQQEQPEAVGVHLLEFLRAAGTP